MNFMKQVRKNICWLFLLLLPVLSFSQNYQWQWAKQAGGVNGSVDWGFNYIYDQSIKDIAVDNNNNIYYLMSMNSQSQNVDGVPVTNYGLRDLFLFSTDCAGNVRWSRAIGGSQDGEYGWNIKLDNNGGLYILSTMFNAAMVGDPTGVPIHFDETHIIPPFTYVDQTTVDPNLRASYLLKYNTSNGNLVWSKPLQGDVSIQTRNTDSYLMYMDSSKNIHTIIGLRAGTHLNGTVTVPSTYIWEYQYYLVKFNYDNGNMTMATPLLLPMTGGGAIGMFNGKTNLIYDENLNRYYLEGNRLNGSSVLENFSYNNTPITKGSFVLAFDGTTGAEIWRKELNCGYTEADEEIHSIIKDPGSSDLYLSGHYFNGTPAPATFGNYTFPPRSYNEAIPFVMKLNADGIVQWTATPETMTNNYGFRFAKGRLVLNGDEIAFAKGSRSDVWGNFAMEARLDADPLIVRLNKNTGAIIGTQEIHSQPGSWDEFTAITTDHDGNYILGGFFHNNLFANPSDGLSMMTKNVIGSKSQAFFAKYGKSVCSQLSVTEVPASQAGIQLYPNPVQDILYIKSKEPLVFYELYGSTGQLISQDNLSATEERINLSSLQTGIYYIKIQTKSAVVTEKIIKK